MSNANPLKNFIPDTWYKLVVGLGITVLLTSLFAPIQGLPRGAVQILSLGAVLHGLGTWKGHKTYTLVMDYSDLVDGNVPKPPRRVDWGATLLRFVGFLLILDGASWLVGRRLLTPFWSWIQTL